MRTQEHALQSTPKQLPFTITKVAQEKLVDALKEDAAPDHRIRVGATREGFAKVRYLLDFVEPTQALEAQDTLFALDALTVIVDATSQSLLAGSQIDFVDDGLRGAGFKFLNPDLAQNLGIQAQAVEAQEILDRKVNPQVASHGGRIELVGLEDHTAKIRMHGGCQGCGQASTTIREGVERALLGEIQDLKHVVDITDHDSGETPYYAPNT